MVVMLELLTAIPLKISKMLKVSVWQLNNTTVGARDKTKSLERAKEMPLRSRSASSMRIIIIRRRRPARNLKRPIVLRLLLHNNKHSNPYPQPKIITNRIIIRSTSVSTAEVPPEVAVRQLNAL